MLKWFMLVFCPAFVLLSGLVSCRSDVKDTDVYSPPAPKIRGANGVTEFADWNNQTHKTVDLQDRFDLNQAAPTQYRVKTECRLADHTYHSDATYKGTNDLTMFQIFPEELLRVDLKQNQVMCSFEFDLYNGNGSNHVFSLPLAPITDDAKGEVKISQEPDTRRDSSGAFSLENIENLRLRYANAGQANVQIYCTDFTTAALTLDTVVDMSHFDFDSFRRTMSSDYLTQHPRQTCRALVSQFGSRKQISDIFELSFMEMPLEIKTTESPFFPLRNRFDMRAGYVQVANAHAVVIKEWSVTNPQVNSTTHSLQIPNGPLHVVVNVIVDIGPRTMVYSKPWGHVQAALDPGVPVTPAGAVTIVTLQPGQMARIQASVQAEGTIKEGYDPQGALITSFQSPEIDEFSEHGHKLNHVQLVVEPELFMIDRDINYIRAAAPLDDSARFSWP